MIDIQLSKNFTLSELTKSTVALRYGLDNYPKNPVYIENLRRVAEKILQPCRNNFKTAIKPTSGYRTPEVNKLAGSKAENSQHLYGQAVDFEVPGVSNYDLACWIRDNLEYDQLILEYYTKGSPNSGWIHCSIKETNNRMQELTTHDCMTYHTGLIR